MKNIKQYSLAVIGAGSGGLVAAELAAKLGARVVLIEAEDRMGGECLHTGCVPSKALIHAARTMWAAGHNGDIGVSSEPRLDFQKVKTHLNHAIDTIEQRHDNDDYYQTKGVDVIHGRAAFIDSHTIKVDEQLISADRFIISTGSKPAVPTIDGLSDGSYLTNETIFSLDDLPKRMIVIGGGPIGCELGQAFAMLGTQVVILQSAPRLLPREPESASQALADSFAAMHIDVKVSNKIQRVQYFPNSVKVTTDAGEITADKLLIATGRRSNLPNGLDLAGVQLTERGIKVDKHFRSSMPNIYAIGDCNGGIQFTHTAAQQAGIAVQNALFNRRKTFDMSKVSWTTFTTPEIAHYGPSGPELEAAGISYVLQKTTYEDIDKAIAEKEHGFAEIMVGGKGKILGAVIVGANAAEILAQLILAGNWNKVATIMQAYPSYASGFWLSASDNNLDLFVQSRVGKITNFIVKKFR